ncbi:MAG: hypothetical protein AAB691_01230 [Patescibacteria group bacterium]
MTTKEETLLDTMAQPIAQTLEVIQELPTKQYLEERLDNCATKEGLEDVREDIIRTVERLVKEDLRSYIDLVHLNVRVKILEEQSGKQRRR